MTEGASVDESEAAEATVGSGGSAVRDQLAPLDRSTDLWPGEHIVVGRFRVFVRHLRARERSAARAAAPGGQVSTGRALYVHGLGGSSLNWTDLAQVLSPVLDGHVMDLPGFGFSDPPVDGSYSLTTMTDAVIAVLEHLVAQSDSAGGVHLVGNSLGGAVAARVAAQRPDLVTTLTLISPAFPDLRPRLKRLSFIPLTLAAVPRVGPAVFGYLGRVHARAQVAQTLNEIMERPQVLGPTRIEQAVEHAVARADMPWAPAALSGSLTELVASWLWMSGRDHWRRAATISVPTLVMWGGRDKLVSSAIAPRLVRAIVGSRLVMFGAVGHVCQMEIPVETAREIARHVETHAASAT
ncbi:alpha/beta fold hydrolase [Williamsia sp. CHRR-6]|uniref:alpha/beta fold hydrolase n=1 Tax=Williamsia sp. CHRR-6 TaxID=2835871 RepID=UPI001BDA09AD|nr:alpha/beta hydrolase [Williamsia sp. CHRR-6]MBT0565654.1 alpha/beta hydrolase [Williamsia sp. CHRR-6]